MGLSLIREDPSLLPADKHAMDSSVSPVAVNPASLPTLPGIGEDTQASAIAALESGKVGWVVISGKMAAGKDTVAAQISDIFPTSASEPPVLLGYGDLMRAELATVIEAYAAVLSSGAGFPERKSKIQEFTGLREAHAKELTRLLDAEFAEQGKTPSVFDRTENMRKMLQGLGGVWRTEEDPVYWVRKAVIAALEHAAAGRSVLLTGARYLPDVEMPSQYGAVVIRLDVDRETQLARLRSRDGISPSPATLVALDHPGETALDHWTGFAFRFSNTGSLDDTVQEVREALVGEFARRGQAFPKP